MYADTRDGMARAEVAAACERAAGEEERARAAGARGARAKSARRVDAFEDAGRVEGAVQPAEEEVGQHAPLRRVEAVAKLGGPHGH